MSPVYYCFPCVCVSSVCVFFRVCVCPPGVRFVSWVCVCVSPCVFCLPGVCVSPVCAFCLPGVCVCVPRACVSPSCPHCCPRGHSSLGAGWRQVVLALGCRPWRPALRADGWVGRKSCITQSHVVCASSGRCLRDSALPFDVCYCPAPPGLATGPWDWDLERGRGGRPGAGWVPF